MKALITVLFASLMSLSALAAAPAEYSIPSMKKEPKIALHKVSESIVLGYNKEKNITVRLVGEYYGEGTDVSPRKNLFLTFFHAQEMFSTHTVFDLGQIWKFVSATRLSAGVYEINYIGLDLKEDKMIINTAQVFEDERKLKNEDFTDTYFHSSIKMKDTATDDRFRGED